LERDQKIDEILDRSVGGKLTDWWIGKFFARFSKGFSYAEKIFQDCLAEIGQE
jgi:hypothetical protein